MCVSVWVNTGQEKAQKRLSCSLELKFQVLASCPTCMLGTTLGSSARAVHTLNCRAFSPELVLYFKLLIYGGKLSGSSLTRVHE